MNVVFRYLYANFLFNTTDQYVKYVMYLSGNKFADDAEMLWDTYKIVSDENRRPRFFDKRGRW